MTTALALVCTLSPSPAASSSELLARQLLDALGEHGVTGTSVRVVDHDVRPGVELDMGDGDAWPAIREQVMAADILILSPPTWMGQHSSVCQRVLERLDAELSERDDQGRPRVSGKVGLAAMHTSSPGVGVVGSSPGGCVSWYARSHGLQCSAITAVEVVLGDGTFVRATEDQDAELLWAARGGGGGLRRRPVHQRR